MPVERRILLLLSAMYFTYILDYMLMPALTQVFARTFSLSPQAIGTLVSAYNFSASAFGIIGALFLDRFNRKHVLVTLYAGFATSLLLCGLAPSIEILIATRVLAGAFGGLIVATIFSVIGDVVEPDKQGAAFGFVLSSFAVSSVVGVPLGLFLAEKFNWQSIFFFNAIVSATILCGVFVLMPDLTGHLSRLKNELASEAAGERIKKLLFNSGNLAAIGVTALIGMASYSVIPFINPFLAANIGLNDVEIRYFYIAGGIATFLVSYPTGWLADKLGKWNTFAALSIALVPSTLLFTTMPAPTYALLMTIFVVFMTLSRARRAPALAMITSSVAPSERAGFMSLNISFEQLASGFAASLAGAVIVKLPQQPMENYFIVGLGSAACAFLALVLLRVVKPFASATSSPVVPTIAATEKIA
jgi:MFS transporter, DHA1 family, inner membrane transport protein